MLLEASADFHGDGEGEALYGWNADGALISDTGRGILTAEYSPAGSPLYVGMAQGYAFHYVYGADGRRLRSSLSGPRKAASGWTEVPGTLPLPAIAGAESGADAAADVSALPQAVLDSRSVAGCFMLEGDSVARIATPWGWLTAADGVFHSALADRRGDIRVVACPLLADRPVTDGDSIKMRGASLSGGLSSGGLSGAMQRFPTFRIGAETYIAEQANFYYPFGLPAAIGWGADANARKFGGKELELRRALGLYDFGARLYDPALASFTSPDPLASIDQASNPYAYCRSNPVSFWDPSGMRIECAGNDPDKEMEIYQRMKNLSAESDSYAFAFNFLSDSDNIYYISVEKTTELKYGNGFSDFVKAEYHPNTRTFAFNPNFKSGEFESYLIGEETLHAVQNDLPSYLQDGEYNLEYEAKIFGTMVSAESGNGSGDLPGIGSFGVDLRANILDERFPLRISINEYISGGKEFTDFYQNTSFGNESVKRHHTMSVTKLPKLLEYIINQNNNYQIVP